MESAALAQEIEQLESELAGLRARVDEDGSSFSALEQQIEELRSRLTSTREAVRSRESELEEKMAALAEARRLEQLAAYEGELDKLRKSREAVVTVGQTYLSALDRYDGEVARLEKRLDEMRAAFGDDDRVATVARALEEDATLNGLWRSVLEATQWRSGNERTSNGVPEVAHEYAAEPAWSEDDLSDDLKERAGENRAARILDYFK